MENLNVDSSTEEGSATGQCVTVFASISTAVLEIAIAVVAALAFAAVAKTDTHRI